MNATQDTHNEKCLYLYLYTATILCKQNVAAAVKTQKFNERNVKTSDKRKKKAIEKY